MKTQLKVSDILKILDGELLCGEKKLDADVNDIGATDLLSDVLALDMDQYALLTGLTNAQIIRTAEITNACCVVIVRGKHPQPQAVSLAKRHHIPLILCRYTMYESCAKIDEFLRA